MMHGNFDSAIVKIIKLNALPLEYIAAPFIFIWFVVKQGIY